MLRSLPAAALAAALLLPGCAGRLPEDPATAGDHAGNPDAAVASLPPRTHTLAVGTAGPAPAGGPPSTAAHTHAGPGEAAPLVPLPGESAPAAGGHDAMPGMAGMQHGEQGVTGTVSADAPAPEEAPAADPPAAPGAIGPWTCVMHREVHAGGPGECPICGMKLVKEEATR